MTANLRVSARIGCFYGEKKKPLSAAKTKKDSRRDNAAVIVSRRFAAFLSGAPPRKGETSNQILIFL